MTAEKNKNNPLLFVVLGLMIFLFGIIDMLLVSPALGIPLAAVGLIFMALGWNRHKQSKRQQPPSNGG